MNILWIQLGLIASVLGIVIVGTFYFWCSEWLDAVTVENKDEMDCHSK